MLGAKVADPARRKPTARLAHPGRLLRPFGGGGELGPHLLNREAVESLKAQRMTCVLWNAIHRDFADPDRWVQRALEQCTGQPWTLVVLQIFPTVQWHTCRAS